MRTLPWKKGVASQGLERARRVELNGFDMAYWETVILEESEGTFERKGPQHCGRSAGWGGGRGTDNGGESTGRGTKPEKATDQYCVSGDSEAAAPEDTREPENALQPVDSVERHDRRGYEWEETKRSALRNGNEPRSKRAGTRKVHPSLRLPPQGGHASSKLSGASSLLEHTTSTRTPSRADAHTPGFISPSQKTESDDMMAPRDRDATALLVDVREGKPTAEQELYDQVYAELRERARGQRKRWKGDPSLQTTALVHEAYLKLVGPNEQSWKSRSHFFAVASRAMRQILLNEARRRRTEKRGGDAPVLSLEALQSSFGRAQATTEERDEMLVVLDAALDRFSEDYPRAARVVECRFFGGMTIKETAEALGISEATVSRDWSVAQTRLYQEMQEILEPSSSAE